MTGSIVMSFYVAGGDLRFQYYLQAQDGNYVVFQVRLPSHIDETLLAFERSGDGLVSGGLHAAAVYPQRAGRAACLGNAQRSSLGQDHIQPFLRNGLEVSGQGGVVGNRLVCPRYLYHGQVTFHIAGGLVPCDHQDADEIKLGLWGVRGGRPLLLFSWCGHGFSRTRLAIMSTKNAVSVQCPKW